MTPDRRTSGSVLSRTGPMLAVIGIHAAILYLLMISMGVVDMPKFVPPVEAVFIPEQSQTQPEEVPVVKPDLVDIAEPTEQPPPEIQFDEVVVPPADVTMPASNDAAAATTAPAGQVQDLKAKTRIEPTYPAASRRAGEEGTVRLKVLVDETGRPKDVQVAQSSGFTRLDEAARQAVRKWNFQAAMNAGQAVSVWTQVAITFRLTDEKSSRTSNR